MSEQYWKPERKDAVYGTVTSDSQSEFVAEPKQGDKILLLVFPNPGVFGWYNTRILDPQNLDRLEDGYVVLEVEVKEIKKVKVSTELV